MVLRTTESRAESPRLPGRLSAFNHDAGILSTLRLLAKGGVAALLPTVFVLVAGLGVKPLSDPDTYWHLVMGHKFLDGTSIRHPGPMSALGTQDWRPRDWLTQLVAAQFDSWFGLAGVAWLFALGLVIFVVAVFRVCRQQASFVAAALATPFAVLGGMNSLSARPQIASFCMLAVTLGAVLRTADDLRPRWWLAPLTGLWACLHGMWFLGVVLQVVVLVGLLLDRRLEARDLRRMIGLIAVTLGVVALTPNGPALLAKPLGVANLTLATYIAESKPPALPSFFYVVTLGMIAVTVVTWIRVSRVSWVHILLAGLATLFALEMVRTVTIGAILIAPLFAGTLDRWVSGFRIDFSRATEKLIMFGCASTALVAVALVAPSTADRPAANYPVSLDAQLDALPSSALVFNELEDGGFLTWRHPDLRIVVDGLSDQYSESYLLAVYPVYRLEHGWNSELSSLGVTHALLFRDTALADALQASGWKVTASDSLRVLLARP